MCFFFSVLSFFFKLREREREYTKFGIRRNSPKVTYLIFRWGSTGESFFFYGLIDFTLFLTLAWRWLLRVSQIFFSSSPGVLGFWFCLLRTLPNNWLFSFLFPLTGGSPHFRFRGKTDQPKSNIFYCVIHAEYGLVLEKYVSPIDKCQAFFRFSCICCN